MPYELTPTGREVLRIVRSALLPYGEQAALVTQEYDAGPGMWQTRVQPSRARAAPLTAGFDGEDLLSVTIGNTEFEMFPVDEALDDFAEIVEATFAGRVEEARLNGFARIYTAPAGFNVGAVHLPWPWRLRFARRYTPYGPTDQPDSERLAW